MPPHDSQTRHLAQTELQSGLPHILAAPRADGTLEMIVIRPATEQRELPETCELTPEDGIPRDRWARDCTRRLPDGQLNPDTQLTLMNVRVLSLLAGGRERWPLAGDNLIVDFDLSRDNLPTGQRVRLGEAVLEISEEPHNGCSKFSARFGPDALRWVNSPDGKLQRLRGVNASVVRAGRVRIGDRITKV